MSTTMKEGRPLIAHKPWHEEVHNHFGQKYKTQELMLLSFLQIRVALIPLVPDSK